MATSSVQGFVKSANLQENELDRQALNNLATAPIADDISLFINNLKNESVLEISNLEYDRITGLITIENTTAELAAVRSGVFTNGDIVRIEELDGTLVRGDLFIAQSDGVETFGFATDENLNNQFIFSPNAPFRVIRNDGVLLSNISNLGVQQNTASFSTGLGTGEDGDNDQAVDLDNAYAVQFGEIYEYLDIAKFLAESKFVNDEDVASGVEFAMEGTFTIRDPSDLIVQSGIDANSPGIYITDPSSPVNNISKIRAFSDTFNPWEDTVTALTTQSLNVSTGNLKLNNGIDIVGVTPISESGVVNNTTFTHKIKVNIEGIDYFLCLTSA